MIKSLFAGATALALITGAAVAQEAYDSSTTRTTTVTAPVPVAPPQTTTTTVQRTVDPTVIVPPQTSSYREEHVTTQNGQTVEKSVRTDSATPYGNRTTTYSQTTTQSPGTTNNQLQARPEHLTLLPGSPSSTARASKREVATPAMVNRLLDLLGIDLPIIQAPMAGISSPAMAAAVADAGALGSIGVGATDAAGAAKMIAAVRERTSRPLNVNVFCHRPAKADRPAEAAWIERLRPEFEALDAMPPASLGEIYRSFVEDDAMLSTLIAAQPKIVSFHFGLPAPERVSALRNAGIVLLASATSLAEAHSAVANGVDAIVAQGYEAGGHRGLFDPEADDDRLGTTALTRIVARAIELPVIAAGGIMDGAGIAAALDLGAAAAQLGTAFVGCAESLADGGHRAALFSEAAHHTVMTRAISGRPARSLANRFTRLGAAIAPSDIPAYPIAYDLGKALHAAGKAKGEFGFGAQWAGQGAPLARAMPAGQLVRTLADELSGAHSGRVV